MPKDFNKTYINKFNKMMVNIESKLNRNDLSGVCSKAKDIDKFIQKDINQLREAEPNYSWDDIQALMKEIPNQLCPDQ
ncbi:hypothetical protein [Prochlorococcus sp. MIT 0603]|uniref:hypothetical protein n=1 Tax=Prochlorococcus sp. MIT 0603 TaxID=1499500 RepID=UPI00126946AB|nr:hypothetical protein [Prochlorococcus sp. MIT 0603]